MELYQLLNSATDIGYQMLRHGAEIYRVEESIRLILLAYGYPEESVNVFAIPNFILVTLSDGDGKPCTTSRRVKNRITDLHKVDKLNNLSRHICKRKPSCKQINLQLEKIMSEKGYSLAWQVAAYAFISALFTIFFSGSFADAFSALFIGAFIRIFEYGLLKLRGSSFFSSILCSSAIAFMAFGAVNLGFADGMDKIVIGSLMPLVPGLALTNCMRDFIAGDVMAGLSRMAEALLTAIGLAAGVTVTLTILRNFL